MALLRWANGERFLRSGAVVTIGRDPDNDIVLPSDKRVSRRHAELRPRQDQWILVDLDSRNGTLANGRSVHQHPLVDGDRIVLGGSTLTFVAGVDPNETEAGAGDVPVGLPHLTERERQVVALVAEGLTDKAIGDRLFISPSTVRSHLDRINEKTGLRRRPELTRLAVALDLLH